MLQLLVLVSRAKCWSPLLLCGEPTILQKFAVLHRSTHNTTTLPAARAALKVPLDACACHDCVAHVCSAPCLLFFVVCSSSIVKTLKSTSIGPHTSCSKQILASLTLMPSCSG